MAKSSKRSTKSPIESIDDLANAGLQQQQKEQVVVDDIQERANKFLADNVIAWDAAEYYKKLSVQLLILKSEVVNKLRNHQSATKELGECEELMHSCLMLADKHKYTYPSWRRDLATLDYHLVALAEINEMLGKHEWPTDTDNRPVRLSTYLESILWY